MSLGGFIGLWIVMMAAMMLPAIAPLGSMYVRGVRLHSGGVVRGLRMIQLLIGYLGVWALFGLAAFAAAWAGGRLAQHDARAALYAASAILLVGGSYQLTPLKDACLKRCRSPIATLLHFAEYKGRLRDLRVGITHGGSCLGCCWGLMMVLVAVGVMDVAWMAGLAAVIFLEKVWRWGKPLGVAFGIALIVLAFFVPSHPWLVPGLHASNTPSMVMKG